MSAPPSRPKAGKTPDALPLSSAQRSQSLLTWVDELSGRFCEQVRRAIGVDLDGSLTSLAIVDYYLGTLRDEERAPIIELVAAGAGAYFGEVVRREVSGTWIGVLGQPRTLRLLLEPQWMYFAPVDQAYESILGTSVEPDDPRAPEGRPLDAAFHARESALERVDGTGDTADDTADDTSDDTSDHESPEVEDVVDVEDDERGPKPNVTGKPSDSAARPRDPDLSISAARGQLDGDFAPRTQRLLPQGEDEFDPPDAGWLADQLQRRIGVSEEIYYSLTGRFESLELMLELLAHKHASEGRRPRAYGIDDYLAELTRPRSHDDDDDDESPSSSGLSD